MLKIKYLLCIIFNTGISTPYINKYYNLYIIKSIYKLIYPQNHIKKFNNYNDYLLKEIYLNLINESEKIQLLFTKIPEDIIESNQILIPYYEPIDKKKNLKYVEINNEIYYINPNVELNQNSELKFNKYYSSIKNNNCLIYSILIILHTILTMLQNIDHNIYNKMKNELILFTNSNNINENFFTDKGELFKIFKHILGKCDDVEYTDNINKLLVHLPKEQYPILNTMFNEKGILNQAYIKEYISEKFTTYNNIFGVNIFRIFMKNDAEHYIVITKKSDDSSIKNTIMNNTIIYKNQQNIPYSEI